MRKEDCYYLGKIVKKHGYKGEISVKLDTDEPQFYKNMESVLVELNNSLVPFFIEKSDFLKSSLLRVQFEGVYSETEADSLLGASLYLPLSSLPPLTGNRFYYHEVIGFSVEDIDYGFVGTIKSINENRAQDLFEITNGHREVLIPVNDYFIKEVDREQKKIIVKTPEGLLSLYL